MIAGSGGLPSRKFSKPTRHEFRIMTASDLRSLFHPLAVSASSMAMETSGLGARESLSTFFSVFD